MVNFIPEVFKEPYIFFKKFRIRQARPDFGELDNYCS
jgi:hypothetical protein